MLGFQLLPDTLAKGSLCYMNCLWVPGFMDGKHPVDWRLSTAVLLSFS